MPLAQIARDLGVSRPVLYKFIRENGISHEKYSTLSEQEVQNVVAEVKKNHPNAGEVMLQGHLQSKGITLQRHKIRTAIHAVDPDGVEARKRPTIKRRVYSVPYPNYLWHIDGNHKLIRWRIVLHHGIDGYSRMVVFAQFSTNNRAITVEDLFKAAIQQYGCPVRVRTDYGGENVGVWRHMVNVHGEDSRAVIAGSSVHNQRIERHNRIVNEQVIAHFKSMFYQLESESALDPSNETDLFCLHHVFLPLLNKSLSEFVAAHNNHKVSTEENKMPVQIFLGSQHLTEIHTDHRNEIPYQGLDVNSLLEEDLPYVECDDTEIPLDDETMVELQNTINIFSLTDPMELYRQTVQFVGQKLLDN